MWLSVTTLNVLGRGGMSAAHDLAQVQAEHVR